MLWTKEIPTPRQHIRPSHHTPHLHQPCSYTPHLHQPCSSANCVPSRMGDFIIQLSVTVGTVVLVDRDFVLSSKGIPIRFAVARQRYLGCLREKSNGREAEIQDATSEYYRRGYGAGNGATIIVQCILRSIFMYNWILNFIFNQTVSIKYTLNRFQLQLSQNDTTSPPTSVPYSILLGSLVLYHSLFSDPFCLHN